jgi:hypothetical protein
MIHGSLISGGAIESALKKPWQDLIICLEAGVGWHRIVRDSSLGEKFCTARWGHYMVHYVLHTDQNMYIQTAKRWHGDGPGGGLKQSGLLFSRKA